MNKFGITSPIECYKLKIIALYCLILLILSLIFNSLLILVFMRYRKLLTTLNMFILTLTILNLIASIIEFSFVIPSNYSCKWIFDQWSCNFCGFVMYFVGCSGVYIVAAISIERYYIIYKPWLIENKTLKDKLRWITICLILAVIWPIFPLFGWSHYTLEGSLTSCTVEWTERSANVISYNFIMFICVFIIPFSAIGFTNLKLALILKKMPILAKTTENARKKFKAERKLTIITFFYNGGFLLTWIPYAIGSIYVSFISNEPLNPLLEAIPAMFAKSSLVWSTILYIYSNDQIRSKISLELFKSLAPIKESESSTMTSASMKVSRSVEIKKFDIEENSHMFSNQPVIPRTSL